MELQGKPVRESRIETHDIVHPFDANAYECSSAGIRRADGQRSACMAAYRHAGMKVTTVSVDGIYFQRPAPVAPSSAPHFGELRVFHTSDGNRHSKVTGSAPGERKRKSARRT